MYFYIGIAIIIISIATGFLAEGGNPYVMLQPFALLIIIGTAAGIFLLSYPKRMILEIIETLKESRNQKLYSKQSYTELLVFLMNFFRFCRSQGAAEIEKHIEAPHLSAMFKGYPALLNNKEAVTFLCDYTRILIIGYDNIFELENLMNEQISIKLSNGREVAGSFYRMADTLPAIGIIAAVLGIINAMGSIGLEPKILGQKIASALMGTFFGIALAYCVFSPLATLIEKIKFDEAKYMECIKSGFIAFAKGAPPTIAVEFARQSIPFDLKPEFSEVEAELDRIKQNIKSKGTNG